MFRLNFLVVILFLSVVNCFSQSHQLTFNLEKGRLYKLKQSVEQTTSQNILGNVQQVETTISSVMSFDVKENTNEFLLIDVSITEMLFKMKSPVFSMEYDSKKDVNEGDLLGKIYSKVMGKKYSVLVSKNGEVMQVEGLDGLINSIIEESNVPDDAAKAQLNESVKKMFGEAVVKGNMEMLTYLFPKQNVRIGDKWSNKVSLEAEMPVDFINTWELKNIDSGVATISGVTTIRSKDTEDWKMVNGIPTKYEITGNQSCLINLDEKTGWIISSDVESRMKGKIVMDKSEKMPQKMEIPIEIITKTKYLSVN